MSFMMPSCKIVCRVDGYQDTMEWGAKSLNIHQQLGWTHKQEHMLRQIYVLIGTARNFLSNGYRALLLHPV